MNADPGPSRNTDLGHSGEPADREDFTAADFSAPLDHLARPGAHRFDSGAFVDATLARVRAERAQTDADAAQVDAAEFPSEILAALRAPEPSPDFVERTLAAIGGRSNAVTDRELDRLLAQNAPPRISPDFVERTLAALRESTPSSAPALRLLPVPARRQRRLLAAAAALVLVTLGVLALRRTGAAPADDALVASSEIFSPSPSTTLFARHSVAAPTGDDLDFRPLDGLTLLAAGIVGGAE